MSASPFVRQAARRWAGYALVAVLFAIACGFLSHWQFERNEARAETLALVERNYDAPPTPVEDVLDRGYAPSDEWHPVTLTGRYLDDDQLLVRNRAQGGTSAFEVLVPFQLVDGRIVVIDRGWVPPGEQTTPDAVPAAPDGEVEVIARVRPGESLPASGRTAPDGQVPTIHLPTIASATGPSTETAFYGLMVSEDPAPAERPQELSPPTEDPGPHLSYAIQWILFAIMGFAFIAYMIRTEIRARREELEPDDDLDDEVPGEDEPDHERTPSAAARRPRPGRPRRTGRRDRDAEEEDALIDAGA
ncbi:SURF1 family protein [Microbacterium marinilacus]|uniref:SURF1-like protein n=1 Tax=Microbacterium marinilacus TaxID=415209 RepID=A0ABP7BIW0_9MICO|nr:SURF1 family protein [Microbacterium marinilacus]MBY0688509.1 SURF1 family protein [Microbacterium marinilacus]